jgi:short subunit dehydrogenase-like uncharacterized protein
VASTAGPFGLYGTPIVDACVRFGTHYVDITGETPWMREIAATYHERASAQGTRIIPACGFDSIPSDLGVLLMSRAVRDRLGVACREVRTYFQFSGGLNGGTVASLFNMLNAPRSSGTATTKSAADGRIRLVKGPQYDPEFGTWIGPFVMAPTNTHVVRRSLALAETAQQPYSPGFTYQEAMKFDAPLGRIRATAATAGLGLLFVGLRQPVTRALLGRILPKPGMGPSVKTMDAGWFTCDLLGIAEDGRTMRGLIRYGGDPGNRATTVFVCESALAIARDADALPGGRSYGGVLTPATGLGDVLAERLRRAGTVIHIEG